MAQRPWGCWPVGTVSARGLSHCGRKEKQRQARKASTRSQLGLHVCSSVRVVLAPLLLARAFSPPTFPRRCRCWVPGGSFGGLWGSWHCSCEALGGHLGTFGGILGVIGRSWGGPWASLWETKCSRRCALRCFSVSYAFHVLLQTFVVFLISVAFSLCLFSRWGGLVLLFGSLAGPQGMLEGFLGSLGGHRKFLGGPG